MATHNQADIEDAGVIRERQPSPPDLPTNIDDAWGSAVDFEKLGQRVNLRPISPEVISCSRRTDVPAHYVSGLVKILQREKVLVIVRGYYHVVSLSPETVKAWVWWSKNYGPWIEAFNKNPELFTRYPAHLFHFTITGLDDLESVSASLDERLAQIGVLSRLGKVIVRFDPIVRYRDAGGVVRSNCALITELIPRFKAAGAHEVEFKFCVEYGAAASRMLKRGNQFVAWPQGRKQLVIGELMQACARANIPLRACCPSADEVVKGLEVGACVDGEAINALLGATRKPVSLKKDKGQRARCRCVESKDIGSYSMKCPHNCDYCYAQPGPLNTKFL